MFVSARDIISEMQLRHLHQLLRDSHEGIERSHRILKDHGDASPTDLSHLRLGKQQNVLTVKDNFARNDFSGRRWDETDYG